MSGLTQRQQQLLDLLTNAERTPSFEEMKVALGLKSKSGVHRLVLALEERGFIRRLPDRARAIEVIKPEERGASQEALATLTRRVGDLESLVRTIWLVDPSVVERAYKLRGAA